MVWGIANTKVQRRVAKPLWHLSCARADVPIIKRQLTALALDSAFKHICLSRRRHPAGADIWDLRRNWPRERGRILTALKNGTYRFSPLMRITLKSDEEIDIWAARDAVVLKALATYLAQVLPMNSSCTHIKGHGGLKGAVREVREHLSSNRFALRTDVKSYYASITHELLMQRLEIYIHDRRLLNLLNQYLKRTVEKGGNFYDFHRGISRGSPLSPLMGAFFLYELDVMMEEQAKHAGLTYVRYMDDILVLAPTRWKLRRAVVTVNQILGSLKLEKHPDKTFIGRVTRGFDFLGYHFSTDGNGKALLTLAAKTIENFEEKLSRLYEQWWHVRRFPARATALEAKIKTYINRFTGWANGGLTYETAAKTNHPEKPRVLLPGVCQ